jgi:hypothetical protein
MWTSLISALGNYVAKTGDTMTGPLILSGDPTTALGAATKQYVDSAVTLTSLRATLDPVYVNVTGDTMTGLLILSGDPTAALGATTKQYVDTGLAGKSNVGHTHPISDIIGLQPALDALDHISYTSSYKSFCCSWRF